MKYHHCRKCKKKIEHNQKMCDYSTIFKMCFWCLQKRYEKNQVKKSSKSPVALCKKRIQALLRESAIRRDKVCVMSHYPEAGECGGYGKKSKKLILQAEHLNSRERNFTFGDMRNIVLLCKNHHFYFKKKHGALYWSLIRKHIGEKRWAWVEMVIQDKKVYKMNSMDWVLIEIALSTEIALSKELNEKQHNKKIDIRTFP